MIKKKFSLPFIGFLQAVGLVIYCGLVGVLLWRGNKLFGPIYTFLGPTLFLILFAVSALICALLSLGYPIILFWDKKQTKKALNLVTYTAAWLVFFTLLIILIIVVF